MIILIHFFATNTKLGGYNQIEKYCAKCFDIKLRFTWTTSCDQEFVYLICRVTTPSTKKRKNSLYTSDVLTIGLNGALQISYSFWRKNWIFYF